MKLATFERGGIRHIGAVTGGTILDLSALGHGHCLTSLIAKGPGALAALAKEIAGKTGTLALQDVHLLAPIPRPGKILAIGMNYTDHIKEMGREPPKVQVWFNKQVDAACGPYDPVVLPAAAPDMVDWEAELCVVIGRHCRHVPEARAFEVVAGYMAGNDVSARDWQMASPTMIMGKSFVTHAPMGPWLTTADEIADPYALRLRCLVNGAVMQDETTAMMKFKIAEQIAHLTAAFPLDPGDVIFTGTPAGVGAGRKPQVFLKAGDTVRIEVEKLGVLESKVVTEEKRTVID